jgi:hypothetical protein
MGNTRILIWNCQGVARKRLELIQFTLDKKIDILLLNETHLTNTSSLKIPNYFTYATNRTPKPTNKGGCVGGGTAILVHRRFIHQKIHIQTNSIENTVLHVQLGDEEVRLAAVYKRPTSTLDTDDIGKPLNSLISTVIAGDLNAKSTSWNSSRTNSSGDSLERYLDTRTDSTVTAPDSPTHYPDNSNHSPDVLDIAILKVGSL